MDAIAENVVTHEQARKKLAELDERAGKLSEEIDKLAAILANVPSTKEIERFAEKVTKRRAYLPRHRLIANLSNGDLDGMTFEERRELLEMVFGGKTPDGKRLGVYVTLKGKEPSYRILGRLIDQQGTIPDRLLETPQEDEWNGAERQQALLESVTSSAQP
jgi:hypothetical protein